ncbi:uncharacterized protein At1g66480-like [Mercurialis annua]|uniref:uncharacterized protein At1g66480-like n=1 Tax=Mercurialis annua TaxID=3986 RepID=UPI00216017FB|nr:uncharacterized protein At1g66480-like [Mercurialis annua]
MGNTLGAKKTVKIMKITGETLKLKTPVNAGEVVKNYPGHVLLDSEAVKHYGTRAKPLEQHQELAAKRLYFLVELPKPPTEKVPRRVQSGINMSAKDRLENLMLARRSVSDLSIMKKCCPSSSSIVPAEENDEAEKNGATRVKMRLPKAEVERLVKESKDDGEIAARIMDLCMAKNNANNGKLIMNNEVVAENKWKSGSNNYHQTITTGVKAREKRRVSFLGVGEAEMRIAAAS